MSNQLLDAIISKDVIKINDAFSTQITKHIQRVLDDKRKEIGKTIFSESTSLDKGHNYISDTARKQDEELEKNLKNNQIKYKAEAITKNDQIASKEKPVIFIGSKIHISGGKKLENEELKEIAKKVAPKGVTYKVWTYFLNEIDFYFSEK